MTRSHKRIQKNQIKFHRNGLREFQSKALRFQSHENETHYVDSRVRSSQHQHRRRTSFKYISPLRDNDIQIQTHRMKPIEF